MPTILIIGATRGLGASLANAYASQPSTTVFGTTRSASPPSDLNPSITWIPNVDVSQPNCGRALVNGLGLSGGGGGMVEGGVRAFDVVYITAGYFATESWDGVGGVKWEEEVKMFATSAISVPTLVKSLHLGHFIKKDSKIVLVSSESGSIALRHEKEGGGNYGHHASKAALNMMGRLLSLDLKEEGVVVGIVHPGFMRTEMTRGVGFDEFWEDGGAVTPDEAAGSLIEWVEKELDISKTGQYWAPRGPRDIGTAEVTIGKNLPTPLQLPW